MSDVFLTYINENFGISFGVCIYLMVLGFKGIAKGLVKLKEKVDTENKLLLKKREKDIVTRITIWPLIHIIIYLIISFLAIFIFAVISKQYDYLWEIFVIVWILVVCISQPVIKNTKTYKEADKKNWKIQKIMRLILFAINLSIGIYTMATSTGLEALFLKFINIFMVLLEIFIICIMFCAPGTRNIYEHKYIEISFLNTNKKCKNILVTDVTIEGNWLKIKSKGKFTIFSINNIVSVKYHGDQIINDLPGVIENIFGNSVPTEGAKRIIYQILMFCRKIFF